MTNITFIDKIRIGLIDFEAYIVEDENQLDAFAIFCHDIKEPIILFQQDIVNEHIDINFNQILVDEMEKLKSKDTDLRKEHFRTFQKFVLESEQKAKQIAFQDKKLYYVSDVQLIKKLEKLFLTD